MSDWMDELLADLPFEQVPSDLAQRVTVRLHAHRRMARIRRQLAIASQAGLVIVGLVLLAPQFQALQGYLRPLEAWNPLQALQTLAESPWQSLLAAGSGVAQASIAPLAPDGVLGLALLVLPAAFGLIALLCQGGYQGRRVG
jgi:hypothetical protein